MAWSASKEHQANETRAAHLGWVIDGGGRPVPQRETEAGDGEGTARRQAAVQADDPGLALWK